MVGHKILDLVIMVRVHAGQLISHEGIDSEAPEGEMQFSLWGVSVKRIKDTQ